MGIYRDIEDNVKKESIYNILQDLIRDEEEAIAGYENALKQLSYINEMKYDEFHKAKEVFNHIIEEEREHIKELNSLK